MTERGDVQESAEATHILSRDELAAQLAEVEETVQTLNNLLSSFSARMLRNVDDLKDEMNRRATFGDLQPLQKELEKIRARIDDIVDEVGYGEALDISKVPPSILEAAYQAILDDVVAEMKKVRGVHDAELHIQSSLEQLRLKTSGSELFHYRPHRIHVGIAKPLEKGLVSARQVQMTYDELLRHLLESIHQYTPKNFRALIKIKSQEYAVDKALSHAKSMEQAGPQLQALQSRLDRLEETVTGALRDVQDFTAKLQETLAGVASRESVEALGMQISAIEGRLKSSRTDPTPPPPSLEARVLAALAREPRTRAALVRELEASDGAVKEVLADLERRGRISSSARGRSTMYRTKEETEHA